MTTIEEMAEQVDKIRADPISSDFASCLANLAMFLGAGEQEAHDVRERVLTALSFKTPRVDVVKVVLSPWFEPEQAPKD